MLCGVFFLQLQGMLSPFGELKDCVVIIDKMTQKSKVCTAAAFYDSITFAEYV